MLKYEYDLTTVFKLSEWSEALPETIDFIDYWYNFCLSDTKSWIETYIGNKINAFDWTRWQNDFEVFSEMYRPIQGESFSGEERSWFAAFTQYLVYAFQTCSKTLA